MHKISCLCKISSVDYCTVSQRYGSIYNPNIKYSIPPPGDSYRALTDHDDFPVHEMASKNDYCNATEDFTHNHVVSNWFAESALVCDPIKVQWWNLHQLNECHPSLVEVPTMVVSYLFMFQCRFWNTISHNKL